MTNLHVDQRLQKLLEIAKATHSGGENMSNASKGTEREWFINNILNNIITPPFRIGTGDITDSFGNKTGQSDIVLEYTNSISVPLINDKSPRLYLAEGVCAVIEVKSNIMAQWNQVLESHKTLSPIRRRYLSSIAIGSPPTDYIPHFAVSYKGWQNIETVKKKMEEAKLDGILILDPGLYCGKIYQGTKGGALFAFLSSLQDLTGSMIGVKADYMSYYSPPSQPIS